MRENNLLDFNMYESTLSQNIRQPDGAYAERDCPSPILTTKDITENGEYSATDDGAVGYSSVNVNVSGGGGDFTMIEANFAVVGSNRSVPMSVIYLQSANGEYTIDATSINVSATIVLLTPVNQLTINGITAAHKDVYSICYIPTEGDFKINVDGTFTNYGAPDRVEKNNPYVLKLYWTNAQGKWSLNGTNCLSASNPNISIT